MVSRFQVKSKKPIFGNNGIGWLFLLPVVWTGLNDTEFSRVSQNEWVHAWCQHLEVFVLTLPLVVTLQVAMGYPFWWAFPALQVCYWLTYGALAYVTKLMGGDTYRDHPMEIDSRQHDANNLNQRPLFYWLRILTHKP